ncbi:6109_t:CDS:2 [Entrophospora sp. SA101]|nr:7995_t:CDS:2 [Entrophospora sp. SA101]CAJ0853408.1 6109_t:CDS:2 [Entrophospora sp. SA101]
MNGGKIFQEIIISVKSSRTENLELQNNNESTDGDLEYLNFDDDWKNAVEEALI